MLEADPSMQTGRCGHGQQMSGSNAETVSGDLAVDGKVGHLVNIVTDNLKSTPWCQAFLRAVAFFF